MLMIRVHESTKTIGEKEHYQGMNDRGAIRTTSIWAITLSIPFVTIFFQNGESVVRQFFPIVPLPSR